MLTRSERSITRRWNDNELMLRSVKLLLVDEVRLLRPGSGYALTPVCFCRSTRSESAEEVRRMAQHLLTVAASADSPIRRMHRMRRLEDAHVWLERARSGAQRHSAERRGHCHMAWLRLAGCQAAQVRRGISPLPAHESACMPAQPKPHC